RSLHCLAADGCNRNQTGIVDSDLGASLFLDATYGLALRADEITDLLGVDCHRHNARSVRRQIGTRLRERLRHLSKNVKSAFTRLRQRFLDDLEIESLDLDVHLDRSDTVLSAGDLEVHVAEVTLCAENVGEDSVLAAVLDEAHCDAGNCGTKRDARIIQRE